MKYKFIFFDLFGTLVKFTPAIEDNECRNSVSFLKSRGIKIEEKEFKTLWAESFYEVEEIAKITRDEFDLTEPSKLFFSKLGLQNYPLEVIDGFIEKYMEDWEKGVIKIEGLKELLSKINVSKGIITNTHYSEMIKPLLNKLQILDFFDIIITSIEFGKRKPDPSIFNFALEKVNLPPSEVLFVGDNIECDYLGPRNIAMDAILVSEEVVNAVPLDSQIKSILELNGKLGI